MRAVVQRVSQASVTVDGAVVGAIGDGLAVLVGVTHDDGPADAQALAHKIARLRVFRDSAQKMNRSVTDVGGAVLLVSQFTLYGETRRGNRPSFTNAAAPTDAEPLLDGLADELRRAGVRVETGVFGAMMSVDLTNDGPVTLVVETHEGRVQ